jgi:hypothetical protein
MARLAPNDPLNTFQGENLAQTFEVFETSKVSHVDFILESV